MSWKDFLIGALMLAQLGFIQPKWVTLDDIPHAERWMSFSSKELKDKSRKVADPLTKAVLEEMLENFESCAKNAQKVSAKSIVADRARALELRCWLKGLDAGKVQPADIFSPVAKIEKSQKFSKQKDKDLLLQLRLRGITELVKKSQWKILKQEWPKALEFENQMSKLQKAQFYSDIGDVMISDRRWVDAFVSFSRARDFDASIPVEGRFKNILPLIPKSLKETYEASKSQGRNGGENSAPIMSSEEAEYVEQAQGEISKGDVPSAAEALARLMKAFPYSVKSKWAQDKITELLIKEVEKSRGGQGSSVGKTKIIKEILRLDVERQSEWAKLLFDMQDYGGAAAIYEKMAETHETTPKASKAIYMAARGFQLSQEFGKAKNLYRRLTKYFSMSPEFIDGCIQWALININENELSEAITHLEMARSRKMTSQQDLISSFWLFRTYKQKGEDALKVKVAQDLLLRFPLTYYALIAGYEIRQQLPKFNPPASTKLKVLFSPSEKLAIDRGQALMAAGLFEEASEELASVTQRDLSVDEQYYLSLLFTNALNYPKAFSYLTDIFDKYPEHQNESMMKTLFPKEFWVHVSDDKKRSDVDPYLLLSVMRQESAFRPQAVSRSNAIGLLQMIPPTAEEVKAQLGSQIEIPKDLFDPANNVKFCAFYLAQLIQKFNGDVPAALAAYNAGPTRIGLFIKAMGGVLRDTWVDELPLSETAFYVKAILKNYIFYRILYEGKTKLTSPPWASGS